MHIPPIRSAGSTPPPTVASDHLPITRNINGTNVLSWNISDAIDQDTSTWTRRLPALVNTIIHANPDVLCLQEVNQFNTHPNMLADLKSYLSTYGYKCDENDQCKGGSLVTFYKSPKMTPLKSEQELYFPGGHGHADPTDRYYLLTQFVDNKTGKILNIANMKGPHLANKAHPSPDDVAGFLQPLENKINETLESWNESGSPVNICGDLNNEITSDAIARLEQPMVNHSDISPKTALGTQVGGWGTPGQPGYVPNAFEDAIAGKADPVNVVGKYTKVDDQFLELNGTNKDVDAKVDTQLFSWDVAPTPPGPPPLTPTTLLPSQQLQDYETTLQNWLTKYEGGQSGYLGAKFIQPMLDKINSNPLPFTTVQGFKDWLNKTSAGQAIVSGLLSAEIYSADPDLANMDPAQAQAELKSLFATIGITASVPPVSVMPIPVGPQTTQQYKDALNAWLNAHGENDPKSTEGIRANFANPIFGMIDSKQITSVSDLQNWLQTSGPGKKAMAYLQNSSVYNLKDFNNLTPVGAQGELIKLFSALGITASIPAYPLTPIGPQTIGDYKTAIQEWLSAHGETDPTSKTGIRSNFANPIFGMIDSQQITNVGDMQNWLQNSPAGKKAMSYILNSNVYGLLDFKGMTPAVAQGELQKLFTALGITAQVPVCLP